MTSTLAVNRSLELFEYFWPDSFQRFSKWFWLDIISSQSAKITVQNLPKLIDVRLELCMINDKLWFWYFQRMQQLITWPWFQWAISMSQITWLIWYESNDKLKVTIKDSETEPCKLVLIRAETAPALDAPSQNPLKKLSNQGYTDKEFRLTVPVFNAVWYDKSNSITFFCSIFHQNIIKSIWKLIKFIES